MAAITTMVMAVALVMAVAMAMADGNDRDWGCFNSQKQCLITLATSSASALTCRTADLQVMGEEAGWLWFCGWMCFEIRVNYEAGTGPGAGWASGWGLKRQG